jgi:hypothetical protein
MTDATASGGSQHQHDSQRQSGDQLGGKILLAAVCFGPPLAFFAWVGVRYYEWTVLLIPFVAIIGAAAVYSLAKSFPSAWSETEIDTSSRKLPEVEPTESAGATRSKRSRVDAAWDSVLGLAFAASVILVFSHIGRHLPTEHGILPIGVQAVLAILVVGGIGLLLFVRLVARIRKRNERFK